MKIERVNERQIRCTLTGADLANRQLKISELAYGSEKAKNLFRDMMRQAEFECGFEAEDIPLVIEAIPVSSDCIILIITKVEDPEELDTRFSRFAPSVSDGDGEDEDNPALGNLPVGNGLNEFAEGMINLLREVKASLEKRQNGEQAQNETGQENKTEEMLCLLTCKELGTLASFARSVTAYYTEESALYRNPAGGYSLLLSNRKMTQEQFARICNVATEFGNFTNIPDSRLAYIEEHFEVVLAKQAVQALAQI